MIDRRTFLAASSAAIVGCSAPPPQAVPEENTDPRFEVIRATLGSGGRLGVAAIDTGSAAVIGIDAHSRYAMASTFKLPLAAAVLAQADRGVLRLGDELKFDPGKPLDNSPVTQQNLSRGRLSIEALCAAIVQQSDNSAANLLLRRIGGPEALTAQLRAWGDAETRIDREEMALNSNLSGDPRDTTTPAAMAGVVRRMVLGEVLSPAARERLVRWLRTSVPGPDRLPAGLPEGWRVGHKTGTGANGALNDVAVAWRPRGAPIVIACYQSGGTAERKVRAAAHASVARLVAETFA
ncbi:MAG TPA: class A beta-lactamase [Allosphingosinicella sp.]|jgi:beta-lactamase class A